MKRKTTVRIITFIIMFMVLAIPFSKHVKGINNRRNYISVVVYPGDTLWSIASKNNTESGDVRKLIYEIRQVNKLHSLILFPGQELQIPVR